MLSVSVTLLASVPCVPQPLPPAIDAVEKLAGSVATIEFAAAPSLEYPGRAWVVRISKPGRRAGKIVISRLVREQTCNRYDVEAHWEAPFWRDQYDNVVSRLASAGVSTDETSAKQPFEILVDGTGIRVRLRDQGREIDRKLGVPGPTGTSVSSIFYELVSRYVPESELPTPDWRTPRSR